MKKEDKAKLIAQDLRISGLAKEFERFQSSVEKRLFYLRDEVETLQTTIDLVLKKMGYRFVPLEVKRTKPRLVKVKKQGD